MSDVDRLELAPESDLAFDERQGFWKKLRRGLSMTHGEVLERVGAALDGRGVVDEEVLEFLEEALIAADVGVETSLELVDNVRSRARSHEAGDPTRLRDMLIDEMAILLLDAPLARPWESGRKVSLIVGVNGSGKTTTIAKLARQSIDRGEKVLLVAGDTFRAAAIEQLEVWGRRLGVGVVRQQSGGDPAAVVYDALQAARARDVDHLIIDTAGRLHTKSHLMDELAKIRRVVEREAEGWIQRSILVLDATTGHNAVVQAKEFPQGQRAGRRHHHQARRHCEGRDGGRRRARVAHPDPLSRSPRVCSAVPRFICTVAHCSGTFSRAHSASAFS